MTHEKIKAILADPRQLARAVADPEVLPLLPAQLESIRALPVQLAPFQAKWLLGNLSDEQFAHFRELHPEIVAQRFGKGSGTRYRYSKPALCKAGKISATDEHR